MWNASKRCRFVGSFSCTVVLISMPLWSLFWHKEMSFFRKELLLLRCSLMWSWMNSVVLLMYCWLQILHVIWWTAFLRKYNLVSEMRHLSLVHVRSGKLWEIARLRVCDLWAIRTGMFSFWKLLLILWFSHSEMYGSLKYNHSVLVGWESLRWLWGHFVWSNAVL